MESSAAARLHDLLGACGRSLFQAPIPSVGCRFYARYDADVQSPAKSVTAIWDTLLIEKAI